jgi:RNA polymerase sigma factor (sigma-70 family)
VSDGQLLARFAAHRDELAEVAFTALVRRHGPMVLRICEQILGDRHAAEDAFQVTFLILARRARSIRQPELLGHWLHGVALRTAREVKMQQLRRKQREAARAEEIANEPIGAAARPDLELVCREEIQALHDEVARLPERYRVPVVLCELEGLSYQEAALRLRCPVGTIGVRLKRARQRLRERLIRRGVAPTAGLLGALLCADDASAYVPPVLVESTVQAAMGFAASEAAAAGLVSAGVVSVSEAVLWTMALARLKVAMSLAMAFGIGAAAIWIAVNHQPAAPAQPGPRLAGPVVPVPPLHHAALTQPASNGPQGEAPAPAKGAGLALAGRPSLTATAIDPIDLFPTITGVTSGLGREQEGEGLIESPAPPLQPKTAAEVAAESRLARDERMRGAMLFAKEWVPNDPMAEGGDGLGPVYNDSSCVACHGLGAPGGAGPENKNVILLTATPSSRRAPKGLDQIHPGLRGSRTAVIHRYGTDQDYAAWRRRFYESSSGVAPNGCSSPGADAVEARIQAIQTQAGLDGRANRRIVSLQSAKGANLTLSERNTPPLFGSGRIDAIPSDLLVVTAESQPAGIRGRVSRNRDGRIGRFGWKAQIASLHEFVRGACANELGLEVTGHAQAASPVAPKAKAKGLDMTEPDCDALVAYVRALPAPVVIDPDGPQGTRDMREGRRLFADVGCVSCHVPILGDVQGIYSDLLLHDMGSSLSDSGVSYGTQAPIAPEGPGPQEWRTPPLWGYRDSGPYLHDGRAQNLPEAVALHDGQGKASARLFFTLSAEDRFKVETFLKSLVAPNSPRAVGIMEGAELESRIELEERDAPEAHVRHRREQALARGRKQRLDTQRRNQSLDAATRARVRLPLAQALEKMGKTAGALDYYRQIATDAPDSEAGRLASARIAAISTQTGSP